MLLISTSYRKVIKSPFDFCFQIPATNAHERRKNRCQAPTGNRTPGDQHFPRDFDIRLKDREQQLACVHKIILDTGDFPIRKCKFLCNQDLFQPGYHKWISSGEQTRISSSFSKALSFVAGNLTVRGVWTMVGFQCPMFNMA